MPNTKRLTPAHQERANTLDALLKEKKMTQVQLATLVGKDKSTVGGWAKGRIAINEEACRLLSKALDVPISTFLPYAADANHTGIDREHIEDFRSLSDEGKREATKYVKAILNREEGGS